ncbi:MAG: hypothetical protein HOP17_00625 [Acidobacteria bacterium]|nr:hypothetical protein [Acidobacteriota bacterium]
MSHSVKALLAIVALIAILAVSFVAYTFPHWWFRVGTAEARSASGFVYQVPIYKSTTGDVLFYIREDSLVDEYIFYPSTRLIGIPSLGQLQVFSFFAYSNDVPVPVVLSTNKVKVETDMNIVVDDKQIEFTTFHNLRIKADRNNF